MNFSVICSMIVHSKAKFSLFFFFFFVLSPPCDAIDTCQNNALLHGCCAHHQFDS